MRYEKPELALLGEAEAVVLGTEPSQTPENVETKDPLFVGYDE